MTFLRFGSDETTALSATEKSSENVWFQFWRFRFALVRHHFLNGIKKFLCDNRFMFALVDFAVIQHQTCVNRIFVKKCSNINQKTPP